VTMRLPDGKSLLGKFSPGAPAAAAEAVVLRSAWAQAACPWGILLQEAAPPRRKLGSEPGLMATITKDMHRSALLVRPQEPAEHELSRHVQEATPEEQVEAPSKPKPNLQRSTSELQRNTLQAALAMAWQRTGLEEEEARRRAQNGEIPPPAKGGAGFGRAAKLARAASVKEEEEDEDAEEGDGSQDGGADQEHRREEMVEQFRNVIAWATTEEAMTALRKASWNIEAAMNSYLDTPDRPAPAARTGSGGGGEGPEEADEEAVAKLTGMGFAKSHAESALKAFGNDIPEAANFLLANMDELDAAIAALS